MTFKDLAKEILEMPEERQMDTATVFVRGADEFYPIDDELSIAREELTDQLDDGHFFMIV